MKFGKGALVTVLVLFGIFGLTLSNSLGFENNPSLNVFFGKFSIAQASSNTEWTQDGHDAQRTGFTAEEPSEPWSLAWTWNGPDANGGSGGHIYNAPPEAHTVTGGSNIYIPAGTNGLYALRKSDGGQSWHLAGTTFNATPAYDPATGYLYAGGANGNLYKIDGGSGNVAGTYNAGGSLNKSVLLVGNAAYILTDSGQLHKVNTQNMSKAWIYSAGSNTTTPAAYSSSTGLIIYCTADLNVHAVHENDGTVLWRVKPTSRPAQDPYTFAGFWPVVAEQHGIVFVRLNLGADALWSGNTQGSSGGGVYPSTNAEIRSLLQSNNGALENLFALDLNTGSKKFIPAVGYGGVELRQAGSSTLYLQSGPVPVIKINSDGTEVAYISFRSAQGNPPDGRWDSHMGEMVLDNSTVPGLAAGDMRYVNFPNSYVNITDEQTPFTMAGSTLFHAHWGASESIKIIDRSENLGLNAASPISSQAHPPVIRRQQTCSNFNPSTHWTTCGLTLLNDGRYWNGPGFWVYWNAMDPPSTAGASYSDGLLPRYTYASDGMIVVEGNGGDITVLRYSNGAQSPTATPAPSRTATRTATPKTSQTSTPIPQATLKPSQNKKLYIPAVIKGRPAQNNPPQPTATTPPRPTPTIPPASGKFSNLKIIANNPGLYDKFELQFNVQTSATNLDMPFDPNPPAGVQPGIGVSVSALFSSDNWNTSITQPAFIYQPYTHTVVNGRDHFTPSGAPVWDVRFAPQKAGNWQFRLTVQDSQGTSYFPDLGQNAVSFTVGSASSNSNVARGFIKVSSLDKRYFQFQDGSPFIGVGFNDGFSDSVSVATKMASYQQNQMNLMRVWMSGSGINGSQWTSWASNFLSQDAYLPGTSFDITNTYNGEDVSLRLDDANPCLYADFWQGGVPVEPNTTYTVTARIKVNGISGPTVAGSDFGFVIKQGGWLDKDCVKTGTGKRITAPVSGSTGWITVNGTYTTGSTDKWLGNLYLARENAGAGQVYIDEVHFYNNGDSAKVDLLRQPFANAIEHFGDMNAAQWDLYLQSAETHGVYLKLVIDEKNEWIRNHLGADGKMTATGSNDNFYAAPGTKVRWLEQAWWRYIIARWGYSTAIHSFEYINEGDPYNGRHYEAAEAMAKYFHQNDPSLHMITTSFWAGFPNKEFWSNPQASDIDYADIHAYISTGWGLDASFLPSNMLETRPAYVRSGNASAKVNGASQSSTSFVPRGLVIQGSGEWVITYWMKAEGLSASCPYSGTGSMLRVRWLLDGGTYNGGKEGVVPTNAELKDYLCTAAAGTFDWSQFSSKNDRSGNLLLTSARIILADNNPHELNLVFENSNGTGGTAWIDDVQVINPSGQVQPVIGQFDTTPMDSDTAWYDHAYGDVYGGGGVMGSKKPLIRGETGIDFVGNQNYNPDLLKDTQGIWLHNNVWGQINDSGMSDLFWWATETIPASIYPNYLTFRNFMAGIPIANGNYHDSQAQASSPQLRVLGQRDDINGCLHLWIQNTQHTWKQVVNGPAVTPVSGTITIPNLAEGNYRIEWWNTYTVASPIISTQTVNCSGSLTVALPAPLSDDIAVKISKIP